MPANSKLQEIHGTRVSFDTSPIIIVTWWSMNTTDKSKRMHKIESLLEDSTAPTDVDVGIGDATFLQHTQNNPPLTFGQLAVALLNQLTCMAQQVHLVCDIYNTPSIKENERRRRGSDDMVFSMTGPDQHRSKDWQSALRFSSSKVAFMRFLATEWMKSSYALIISHHEVYLALDNTCHFFTAVDGDVRG